jgi:RNA polymerase sigma-70 factor, ECF subfamily
MSSDSLSFGLRASLKNSLLVTESIPQKATIEPSDGELIAVVQNKEKHPEKAEMAFGQLFDRYYVAVRSVARKILRNPEDVADVIQEAFMDVYQGARSFDPARGSLKTWISYLTYHRSVKRVRLLKRHEWQTGDPDEASSVLDSEVTPEGWIRSLDFGRSLDLALETLNEKQRRTMVLYFFDGVEVEAIATLLGETLGNTRNHLYRGLAKLRSQLMQNHLLAGYIEFDEDQNKGKVHP